MDPLSMMAVAGVASGVAGVGMQFAAANQAKAGAEASARATEYGAKAQAAAINAQAEADQDAAKQNALIAEEKAKEQRAAGQKTAMEEVRSAKLLQSRLGAIAGGSGSGAGDPTIMNLWASLDKEGDKNAGYAQAGSEQQARSTVYQSALDRWTADSNAAIKRRSANDTIIGGQLSANAARIGGQGQALAGYGGALGNMSSMALKYGSFKGTSSGSGATGYG